MMLLCLYICYVTLYHFTSRALYSPISLSSPSLPLPLTLCYVILYTTPGVLSPPGKVRVPNWRLLGWFIGDLQLINGIVPTKAAPAASRTPVVATTDACNLDKNFTLDNSFGTKFDIPRLVAHTRIIRQSFELIFLALRFLCTLKPILGRLPLPELLISQPDTIVWGGFEGPRRNSVEPVTLSNYQS